MWGLLRPDGSFDWIKCDWPPLEHDDYYGAVLAAVAVGSAPEGYATTAKAKAGLENVRAYLRKTPAPDLHHKAYLVWASTRVDGLLNDAERTAAVKELLAKQRPDGGWCLPSLAPWKRRDGTPNDPDAPSDGYATGLALYVVRQAGVPADDPAVRKGVAWLKANQRESGRWFTRSVNNDKFHFITNVGTGFAVLALHACDAMKD
jgi:squalene-hopene/tetraprenyl-beta-curcumene cyclase